MFKMHKQPGACSAAPCLQHEGVGPSFSCLPLSSPLAPLCREELFQTAFAVALPCSLSGLRSTVKFRGSSRSGFLLLHFSAQTTKQSNQSQGGHPLYSLLERPLSFFVVVLAPSI
jgi:hypothetical protein